ncbi:MAG: AarF/UbiB family protein [Peptoniphilaceae bacterium]|nr:AarF/UbiB family protein [Peptoniphilaceae bacterium]MDY6019716.1 AarF/UbiB family protein [Anaerococcus sp.]
MNYSKRKLEIVKELIKSGSIDFMNQLISNKIRYGKISIDKKNQIEYGKKLRLALENLGPVFVKFGQLLSSRKDIFSDAYVKELMKLQDDVAVLDFSLIQKTIVEEFGRPLDQVFVSLDKTPLASGSIAQVYHGTIKVDGSIKEVCVKVLRNGIEEIIETDTKIMSDLAKKYWDKKHQIKFFDLIKIIDEFKKSLYKEINFKNEVNNLKKFYDLTKADKFVKSPWVYEEFSTSKVLTMEYIDGKSIREIINYPNEEKKKISENLVYSYVNQCFSYGFFHADPHHGNIFIDKDKIIYLLDFGIVGSLSENYRFQIMKIFVGASFNQVKLISDAVINMGLIKTNFTKIGEFENRTQEILDYYMTLSLHEIKISDLIEDFFGLLYDFDIQIPAELTLFGKTIFTLEGLIAGLVDNQSFAELAYPIAKNLMIKLIRPKNLIDRSLPRLFDTISIIKDLPQNSLAILRQLSSGNFEIVVKEDKEQIEKKQSNENRKILALVFLGLCLILAATIIFLALNPINFSKINSIMVVTFVFLIILISILIIKLIKN